MIGRKINVCARRVNAGLHLAKIYFPRIFDRGKPFSTAVV
jgi:hypothetical protein